MTDITREQVLKLLGEATPGPWNAPHAAPYAVRDSEGRSVANATNASAGNGALLAAAPDVFRWALGRDQQARENHDALRLAMSSLDRVLTMYAELSELQAEYTDDETTVYETIAVKIRATDEQLAEAWEQGHTAGAFAGDAHVG